MNAIFFFSPSPHLPPFLLLLRAREQEALHHPDRRRKRREGERKRDCDGGIKGYPSLSVTSFIVPCSVLPAHPSSAVTHRKIHFPPTFTHSNNNYDDTHTHQRQTHKRSPRSLSALFHTFNSDDTHTHERTHTLRSVSHTQTLSLTFSLWALRPASHIQRR